MQNIQMYMLGIFEYKNQKYRKIFDFSFENIDNLLQKLGSLKKKIFFVGNCGILYKDMIKSYLKNEAIFLEDTLPSSNHIGLAAFDKYKEGLLETSISLSALYLKKSNAEEKI